MYNCPWRGGPHVPGQVCHTHSCRASHSGNLRVQRTQPLKRSTTLRSLSLIRSRDTPNNLAIDFMRENTSIKSLVLRLFELQFSSLLDVVLAHPCLEELELHHNPLLHEKPNGGNTPAYTKSPSEIMLRLLELNSTIKKFAFDGSKLSREYESKVVNILLHTTTAVFGFSRTRCRPGMWL
eukprot:m.293877 g.293877  ORF g.293877 m.293877 type:complete len:180 (+) comp22962_c0_seq4:1849-2388(+)